MTSSNHCCRMLLACFTALPVGAVAQTAPAPPAAAAPLPLEAFAWLAGCWEGKVNQRDFREEWLPLRGEIMVGASQTAMQGKTLTYEFLRLEPRADAIYYIPMPSGRKEGLFKLASKKTDGNDEIFTFENVSGEFPQRIIYRRGAEGWLFAHVGGQVSGEVKEVIYPMRHVDCQTGEFIFK
jgi:Domain of unknown function (DUF6265)